MDDEEVVRKPYPKRGRPRKETQQTPDGRILMYMQYGASWTTPSGITFESESPYRLLPFEEAANLIDNPRFRKASIEEVKDYYSG